MYDSILFDLDGTLWDATHVTAKIWPTVLARHPEVHRTITEADVQAYMGRTNEELASLLFPDLPYDKAFGLMMESCAVENELLLAHGGKLYPEIPKVSPATLKRFSPTTGSGNTFGITSAPAIPEKRKRTTSCFCGTSTICNPLSMSAIPVSMRKPPVHPAAISVT